MQTTQTIERPNRLSNPPTPASIKVYPQASWTLLGGARIPFIPNHDIHPAGTIAVAITRTGIKSFIKLLGTHSKTPHGYLYNYEPVETITAYGNPAVKAGGKMIYNHMPYEVLSVTYVPSGYDVDTDRDTPSHYKLEVVHIEDVNYDEDED